MSAADRSAPFSGLAIFALIAVVTVGFLAYLVLGAYAPDFRSVKNGGAHAYSTSAVGFAGIAELVKATRGDNMIIREETELAQPGLLVLTPGGDTSIKEIQSIVARRPDVPTLIVLPKWRVERLKDNLAWVRARGELDPDYLEAGLKELATLEISGHEKGELRSIDGPNVEVVTRSEQGRPLVVAIKETEIYILADPDMLNNKGLATRSGAERAMALLDEIALPDEPIGFDVTLAGFGKSPSLLKLAFEPPFLPLTLCLLFAALLAGLHAMWRFGPPAHDERKVAFGKRALAENGAALLRLAKRQHRTGGRYAALTREAVAQASGAPSSLGPNALDDYLDKLPHDGEPFTTLARRAEAAPDNRRLLDAVRDLHQWRRTVTREDR